MSDTALARAAAARASGRPPTGSATISPACSPRRRSTTQTLDEIEEALIASDLGPATAAKIRARLAERDGSSAASPRRRCARSSPRSWRRSSRPVAEPLEIDAFPAPAGDPGRRRQRLGQDHHHRQARAPVPGAGLFGCCSPPATPSAPPRSSSCRIWADRVGVPIIAGPEGGDSSAIVFDGVKKATAEGIDVLIVDTAGRLQNKKELMDELAKIRRVLGRLNPAAPHDVVLVLDATTGQNALSQIEVFREVAGVTGLVMTKLDGTARGGVLVAAAEQIRPADPRHRRRRRHGRPAPVRSRPRSRARHRRHQGAQRDRDRPHKPRRPGRRRAAADRPRAAARLLPRPTSSRRSRTRCKIFYATGAFMVAMFVAMICLAAPLPPHLAVAAGSRG